MSMEKTLYSEKNLIEGWTVAKTLESWIKDPKSIDSDKIDELSWPEN